MIIVELRRLRKEVDTNALDLKKPIKEEVHALRKDAPKLTQEQERKSLGESKPEKGQGTNAEYFG